MSILLAATLAGAAAAALVALPGAGRLRFQDLTPARAAAPGQWGEPAQPGEWGQRPRPAPGGTHALPGRLGTGRALVAVVAVVALLVGPVVAALAGGALVVAARWRATRLRRREVAAERAGAVEACSALAAELSAGRAPAQALAAAAAVAVGPAREALTAAAAAAGLGGDVGSALTSDAPASAVAPLLRSLAACWTVCAASGSGLAAGVQRLEEGLRADSGQRRAVDAELAGPRATAGLLAVLPVVGLLMAAGLGADPLHVLLRTPLGLVCLVLGLALDGLGLLWTTRLVTRAGGSG
jgi:tight adherence protein B